MRAKQLRVAVLMSALGLSVHGCGESTNPAEGKPASLTLVPSQLTLNAVGETRQLEATVYDALGNVLDTPVEFASSDTEIITVAGNGTVTAVGVGPASVTATAESLSKTSEVNVFPVGTDVKKVSGDLQSAVVATALPDPLVVEVSDPGGSPVPGITVTFTVTAGGGSLSVDSATTGADGRASTVLTLGTRSGAVHRVAALAGGVGRTEFLATGLPDVPQNAQVLNGDGQVQPVATVLPVALAVSVTDQYGNGVPMQNVAYAVTGGGGSLSATTVPSDANGIAETQWTLGGTLGTQTVEATVPGVTTSPLVFTAEGTDLTVSGITPDSLVEGQAAQITGTGFETVTANITVTVDGALAQVTNATSTTIDIVVPTTPCFPARDVPVVVTTTTGGTAPAQTKPVKPGAFVNMAVGEMTLLQDPATFCFQFDGQPASQTYLLGVQSAATAGASLTGASVLGSAQGPAPPAAAPPPDAFRSTVGTLPLAVQQRAERWRRHRQEEAARLAADWAYTRSMLSAGRAAAAPSQPMIDSTVSVGQTVTVKVPMLAGTCSDFTSVTATVKAKGTRGIWLKDNANPGPGFTDSDFQSLSNALDNFIFDVDTSYFGAPTDEDGNGRVVVVVSKELNENSPNVLGFVTSRDLLSQTICEGSNEGEFYYAKAPGTDYPRSLALADGPSLIAHEFTHVIQFGRRLIINAGSQFLATFMAEGQATLAEEVVGHAALGNSPGQNYAAAVAFDLGDTDPNDWYQNPFIDLSFYFGRSSGTAIADAPHACSWLTSDPSPCLGRPLWYGVSWSMLRWLNDQFGPTFTGGEQGVQKALVDNDLTGFANIENVVGVPTETILAEWAASLYLDDRGVTGLPSRIGFPSWNLVDIFEGGTLPSSAELNPAQVSFTDFTRDVDVRAASTAYFIVTGAVLSPTAIRVRDQVDGQLPSHMQTFLVRIN